MKSYKMSLNGTELIYDINEYCVLLGNRRLQLNKDEIFPRPKIYFKINNACNMRCSYCFQQTEKSSEKKVDFRHYSILFDKLSSLTDYDFYAFGGEPLLDGNLENWQYLISTTKRNLSLFTNGCFSKKSYSFLCDNKRYIDNMTITLDGPAEIHNARRPLVVGNSFSTIVNNLSLLSEKGFHLTVQINIDDENISSVEKLILELRSEINYPRVTFALNPVLHQTSTISERKILDLAIRLKEYGIKYFANIPTLRAVLMAVDNRGIIKQRCSAGDSLVFDFQRALIYSCPQNDQTIIGKFTETDIILNRKSMDAIRKQVKKEYSPCDSCEFNIYCSNSCYIDKLIDYPSCTEYMDKLLEYIFRNIDLLRRLFVKLIIRRNSMISIVNRILQTDEELIHKLMNSNFSEEIANAAKEICDVFRKNGKVMIIGNGGSAADAQHFAAELVGRFQYNRRPLPAIALNADSAVLTSIANDYSYNSVFERQISAISSAEDIVICLSTSGDSMNVVEAMKYTKAHAIHSLGILGNNGGALNEYCEIIIKLPGDNAARVQEMQKIAIHAICHCVEYCLFGDERKEE